jgi:hypothetical protein
MTDRFSPPATEVKDMPRRQRPSLLRSVLLVGGFSLVALALAWFVAPLVAGVVTQLLGFGEEGVPTLFLVLDTALSTLVFFGACYYAALLSRGHIVPVAVAIGVIGAFVYFFQVDGMSGYLNDEFPLWYTFFPTHVAAAAAAVLAVNTRCRK